MAYIQRRFLNPSWPQQPSDIMPVRAPTGVAGILPDIASTASLWVDIATIGFLAIGGLVGGYTVGWLYRELRSANPKRRGPRCQECGHAATRMVDLGPDGRLLFCAKHVPAHLDLAVEPVPGRPRRARRHNGNSAPDWKRMSRARDLADAESRYAFYEAATASVMRERSNYSAYEYRERVKAIQEQQSEAAGRLQRAKREARDVGVTEADMKRARKELDEAF